jgi:flagellar motor switch protein FliN
VDSNSRNSALVHAFAAALAATLSESLTAAAGVPCTLSVSDNGSELVKRQEKPFHLRITVAGSLHGEFFIEFYERQVAELGTKLLSKPAKSFKPEHAEALEKHVVSSMPALTAKLAEEHGELTFTVARASELAFGGMFVVSLAASLGEQGDLPVVLYFDGELLECLSPALPESVEPPSVDPLNLKLVMDVELNVTLRFGQRKLPLREVLELASGSVIELDRQVDEPVELLLDGKLIARGEAVIVDGNYGLRVTEIPQPMASHFIR